MMRRIDDRWLLAGLAAVLGLLLGSILLGGDRGGGVLIDHVDIVEVNTVMDGDGALFTQVIWWDRERTGRHVVAWRMCQHYDVTPRAAGGAFVSRWVDRDGQRREVWAKERWHSRTTWDVELAARENRSPSCRRGLKHARRYRKRKAA